MNRYKIKGKYKSIPQMEEEILVEVNELEEESDNQIMMTEPFLTQNSCTRRIQIHLKYSKK